MIYGAALLAQMTAAAHAEPPSSPWIPAASGGRTVCEPVGATAIGPSSRRNAIVCQNRLLPGVRPAQDEAILTALDQHAVAVALDAIRSAAHHPERTWMVEVYYPNPDVAYKLNFATKAALMAQGASVSDRSVQLSATDVQVLSRLDPADAYPGACERYTINTTLPREYALLAIVALTTHDTALHAGVCDAGQWSWL